jgi:hypothetical protein
MIAARTIAHGWMQRMNALAASRWVRITGSCDRRPWSNPVSSPDASILCLLKAGRTGQQGY